MSLSRRPVTLLERLAVGDERDARTVHEDRGALMRSVLANLQQILNTRRGWAQAQPALGIPSPNELVNDFPESIERVQRAIGECIRTYEPRLGAIEVVHVQTQGDPLRVHFHISGQLIAGSTRSGIAFATVVDKDGTIRLEG